MWACGASWRAVSGPEPVSLNRPETLPSLPSAPIGSTLYAPPPYSATARCCPSGDTATCAGIVPDSDSGCRFSSVSRPSRGSMA